MTVITLKQLKKMVGGLPIDMNIEANIAMKMAGDHSVPEVKKNIGNAKPYPAVNTRQMITSVKAEYVVAKRRGKRTAVKISVDTPYAQSMEFGSAPHTPPLAPLIEWARYKIAALKRSKISGKGTGKRIAASQKAPPKSGGNLRKRPKLSKSKNKLAAKMAYLVQQKIRKNGIKPRFFMARSMPKIHTKVKMSMRRQMKHLSKKYPIRVTVRRIN